MTATPPSSLAARPWLILRAMRIHQWSKNLLLFVPIIAGHRLGDPEALRHATVAFFVWGLMASAVYLFNDVYDIEADRAHPEKRRRPIAAGVISVRTAIALSLLLGGAGVVLAGKVLSAETRWWLFGYTALSMLYLFLLKRGLLVDVLALAALYTIRIMAGGTATGIVISTALLAFSMFFFASLAFAKRFTEIARTQQGAIPGRGYDVRDLDILRVVGPTCGYLAVFVLALYLNSFSVVPASTTLPVRASYQHPEYLWLLCPLLAYWITRVWFIANRGNLHHDPVVFALKDPKSYLVGICSAAIIAAATYL